VISYTFFVLGLIVSVLLCCTLSRVLFGPRLWLISPLVVLCGYFVLRQMTGVILYSLDANDPAPLFAHALFFLGAALAILLASASRIYRNSTKTREYIGKTPGRPNGASKSVALFFIVLGIFSVVVTFYMLGRIPILYGFQALLGAESAMGMHQARQFNTLEHALGNVRYFGQGYFRTIYTVVSPAFVVLYYLQSHFEGRKKSIVSSIFMLLFVFFGAMNGQIWLSLQVAILFLLAIVYARGEFFDSSQLALIKFVVGAYLTALLFIFLYRYLQFLGGRSMVDGVFFSTINRIFTYPAGKLFSIFPSSESFRFGETWINDLAGILPGSSQSFSYEVHYLVYGGDWGYTLAPGIVASSYVNFGYVGVLSTSFFLNLLFIFLYRYCMSGNRPIKVVCALLVSHTFALSFAADLSAYVVKLITIFLIYLSYVFLYSILKLNVTRGFRYS
jgi:oligosaccharide repeat unit polymerase